MRVLMIDDDARLYAALSEYFRAHEITLEHSVSGLDGIRRIRSESFDVILLDVMMPGIDGLETLRRVRTEHGVPVIMLTARGDETDRVVGLELGADDYVPKPFSSRELLARIRAVLRRGGSGLGRLPNGESAPVVVGDIRIDTSSRGVLVNGESVTLTALEYDILLALATRAGRVVQRTTLLALAGRDDVHVGERTIDVHISHLRKKLGDDPKLGARLQTVRGVGYVLGTAPPRAKESRLPEPSDDDA